MKLIRIVFYSFAIFLGANALLANKELVLKLASYSKYNYDFISQDWYFRFLQGAQIDNRSIALGTSRTSYAVASADILNFGFISSGYRDLVFYAKEVLLRNSKPKRLFVEINPIALTRSHQEFIDLAEKQFLTEQLFRGNQHFLPFLKLPIFFYDSLLWTSLASVFQGGLEFGSFKSELRHAHLNQLLNDSFSGSYKISKELGQNEEYNQECIVLSEQSLKEKVDPEILEQLASLKDEANTVFWIPPAGSLVTLPYQEALQEVKKYFVDRGIPVLIPQEQFGADDFFDCIHLNVKGQSKMTQILESYL